jgi:queuine tRNA-ribosyltransferase
MPVGTQGTVKGVLARDLENSLILANTYHLYLRPGHETIRKLGGLHKFMGWSRGILTDSGGFQVFSLDRLRKVTEEGVLFRSHLNGDRHMFTPESTIDVQLALGSDIMMVLDECLAYPASHEAARVSTERTLRWARAGYAHYRELLKHRDSQPISRSGSAENQQDPVAKLEAVPGVCFPIVQGAMFADLRRHCTEELLALDADGYAIGGLSVGEPRALSLEMTMVTTALLR